MTAQRRASMALRRDIRIAQGSTRLIKATFKQERRRVLDRVEARDPNPEDAIQLADWELALMRVWVNAAETVFPATLTRLTQDGKQSQELTALVQQVVRYGRPATEVRRFVEDRAQGVVTRSRRRIQTVLREGDLTPSGVREVSRALRRLYQTEFIDSRAARIALENVLQATSTFEHAAALVAQDQTGRTYVKTWVTQGDAKVRSAHADIHPKTVGLEEPFKVDGVALRYPRDPAGPPGLVRNCRCWVEHRQERTVQPLNA